MDLKKNAFLKEPFLISIDHILLSTFFLFTEEMSLLIQICKIPCCNKKRYVNQGMTIIVIIKCIVKNDHEIIIYSKMIDLVT